MTSAGVPEPTCTARLRLGPLRLDHLNDVAALLADPRVAATMGGVRDLAFVADRIRRQAHRWTVDGFGLWARTTLPPAR